MQTHRMPVPENAEPVEPRALLQLLDAMTATPHDPEELERALENCPEWCRAEVERLRAGAR